MMTKKILLLFYRLCDIMSPYREIAIHGISDLLSVGNPDKVF